MKLISYARSKPSGVEWLGDVPNHWDAQGVKFCYSIQLGKMLQPEPSGPSDEESPYLKSQHVQWEQVRVTDLPTMWTTKTERKKYAVTDGDLLVCEGGDVGRAAVVYGALDGTIIQNALHRVRPRGNNEVSFLLYVLAHAASQGWFEVICNKSTIAHFTVDKFGALGVALPTPGEQRAIAAFLDRETDRIDMLVAKKGELIERLKEKRTALISRTVTYGLPPDAANAADLPDDKPFNPSGLEAIPQIPSGWTVSKVWLERVARNIDYQDGNHGELHPKAEDYVDDGIPFVMANHIIAGQIDLTKCNYIEPELAASLRIGFAHADDVLLTHKGTIGRVGMVQKNRFPYVILTPQVTYYRCLRNIAPKYLFWFFQGKFWQDQMYLVSSLGTTRGYVGLLDQRFLNLLLPSLSEQFAIAAYLDTETAKLDALVGKVEEAVERLQEYRTALITAAVTGKIDVRKAAA